MILTPYDAHQSPHHPWTQECARARQVRVFWDTDIIDITRRCCVGDAFWHVFPMIAYPHKCEIKAAHIVHFIKFDKDFMC